MNLTLPIPAFFDPVKVKEVRRVPYGSRATTGREWAKTHNIQANNEDSEKICLLIIDPQNTFCLPEFELFVGGRSGIGAIATRHSVIEDNVRLCQFIYRHLHRITRIAVTMDTHGIVQIFHPIFWIDSQGEHPQPMTLIRTEEIEKGQWRVNPAVMRALGIDNYQTLQEYALHYTRKLDETGKYLLTVWPYHALLGGIGHALVSSIEEVVFFHSIVRHSQPLFELKGSHPLTENYSVLRPEVLEDSKGQAISHKNNSFLQQLFAFDKIIIAGQAKSHCVAWTVADLLTEINNHNPDFAQNIYLLEDCSSPVVVPGVIDFTEQADSAYRRFAEAGMKIIRSSDETLFESVRFHQTSTNLRPTLLTSNSRYREGRQEG